MEKETLGNVCSRKIQDKEIHRSRAGMDSDEDVLLTLSRCYFETFAVPTSQSWMRCFDLAERYFGGDKGAIICQRLLAALQSVRYSRRSVFDFNASQCTGCCNILTEHERRLMAVIKSARREQFGAVRMELMMLCEGNNTAPSEESIANLCAALPSVAFALTPSTKEEKNVPYS